MHGSDNGCFFCARQTHGMVFLVHALQRPAEINSSTSLCLSDIAKTPWFQGMLAARSDVVHVTVHVMCAGFGSCLSLLSDAATPALRVCCSCRHPVRILAACGWC